MRNIIIITVLSSFLACTSTSQEEKQTQGKLVFTEKYKHIKIDKNTRDYTPYAFFEKIDNENYFVIFNEKQYQIQIYNWSSGNLDKTIALKKEGPNGIGYLKGFKIIDLNNVLVLPKSNNQFIFLDGNGQVKEKYTYDASGLNSIDSWSKTQNQIDIINDEFHFTQILQGNWNTISSEKKVSTLIAGVFNKEYDSIYNFNQKIPKNYWREGHIDMWFFRYFFEDTFYYTFPADHAFYTTDVQHHELEAHMAKSKYLGKSLVNDRVAQTIEEIIQQNVQIGRYLKLLYDPYEKLYYRFVQLPRKMEKDRDLSGSSSRIRSPFSIIVLDQNYQIINETKFPDKAYNQEMAYVDKDGLWLSIDHPYQELNKENSFDFQLIKFKTK